MMILRLTTVLIISSLIIHTSKSQTLLQTFSEPNSYCLPTQFGNAVAIAGDVNNDGYDDMIVGAQDYDGLRGCAYIFFGGEDPDTIYDVILIGQTSESQFGYKVSGAGDLNHDGFDDIMVSATMESDVRGAVYIYYGGNPMDAIPDVIIRGNHMIGYTGYSIASLGDLNKDGFDDIIIGENAGQYDVYGFGKAQVFYGGNPMDNSADITFYGNCNLDYFGTTVANAGDLNNDGFIDIVVGATGRQSFTPQAYIYFGGPVTDNKADIVINGAGFENGFANSISSAGDVNHDGFDDLIIGSYTTKSTPEGKAYIYFGGDNMDNNPDVTLTAPFTESTFGFEVTGGTDLDKDGYDDVVVGCFYHLLYSTSKSYVYVYKGGAEMDTEPDLVMEGALGYEDFGFSVSVKGDVNHDECNDILVGARFGYINGSGAFLFFGGSELDSISDITLADTPGGNFSGSAISPAGDMNGDGFDDFVMTAASYNYRGRVYLYLGGNEIDHQADVLFDAPPSESNFGNSVSFAGDCNHDGYDDLIIGAAKASYLYFGGSIVDNIPDVVLPGSYQYKRVATAGDFNHDGYDDVIVGMNNGQTHSGECSIFFGGNTMDNLADLNLSGNFTFGEGKSVSSGDVNHDGYMDLVITAENYADNNFTDRILVFLGGEDPDSIADYILQTGSPSLEFRTNSLAIVDFNHDGFDDILVGAPDSEEGKGKVYLFYGGNAINSSPDLEFAGENEDDNFGISVGSAGDLNNDGIDDILIGAAFNDFKGSAYMYFGGVEPDTIADVEIQGEDNIARFGYSVCSPGDMNSDSFPEIAVGSPDRLSNGMVYLFDFHTPKKGQELTFDSPEPVTYGHTPFALSASSNSGLPVEFSVSDNEVAVVSDNTVTIVGAGSVILTARQPGNSTYDAATEITKSLEVYKANLEIRAKDTSKIEGSVNPEFTLLFNGFVNNDNAEDIDVLPAITTDATTGSAVGTYPIILTGGSDHNYNINCINGIITVKEITGVDSPKVGDELLFPNPAYGYVNIPFDYKNLEYTLYNIDGEIIMHHQLIDNQIDVSGLDSGCYFLRIGERMFKFIKN